MSKPRSISLAFVIAAICGGCPTVDLGESPAAPAACRPDPVYFEEVLWPDFIARADTPEESCVSEGGCHNRDQNPRSSFQVQVADPPIPDVVHSQNYQVVTRFLNCGTPEVSTLLTRPLSGQDPHGGGDLFAPGSTPEMVFLEWFGGP